MKDLTIFIREDSIDPIYIQLKNQVKHFIVDNGLTKGTALPSIKVIADIAGVTLQTAERGMKELIKEGVCFRRPKKGTFVDDIGLSKQVSCVGIYFCQDINKSNEFEFYSTLNSQLCEQLTEQQLHSMVWMDSRDEQEKKSGLLPDLTDAIKNKKIQYLLLGQIDDHLITFLEKENFPYAMINGKTESDVGRIVLDRDSLLEKSFEAFQEMSVKTVGMITNETQGNSNQFTPNSLCDRFFKMGCSMWFCYNA